MDRKHLILCEIKRLAQELGRPPKRDEFDASSTFTKHHVVAEFGTFTEALKACGFKPNVPIKKTKFSKQCDRYEENITKVQESFDLDIKPYVNKYDPCPVDGFSALVASDFHSTYTDPFCLSVFLDYNKRHKPKVVILNGDLVDFPSVSRHDKDPSKILRIQDEIDFTVAKILRQLREDNPKATIYWIWGNHEKFLYRHLCQNPALAMLRALQFESLFELESLRINLVANKNFLTTTTKKDEKFHRPYLILGDNALMVSHGTAIGRFHTKSEMDNVGHSISVITGHTHRPQYMTATKFHGRFFAHSLGTMAKINHESHGHDFMPGPVIDWGQSMAVVHIHKNEALLDQIIFGEHFCRAGGHFYYR